MRRLQVTGRRGLAMVALGAAAILGACGESDSDPEPVSGVGREAAGSVTQFADCADWNAGTEAERQATIVDLRGQLTAQSDAGAASVLPDERAHELFMNACEERYAASLRLYKLYVRAAAFEPLRP